MKQLEILIESWESQKDNLTPIGLEYLQGLKRARDLVKSEK